jgi:hypothetical protein
MVAAWERVRNRTEVSGMIMLFTCLGPVLTAQGVSQSVMETLGMIYSQWRRYAWDLTPVEDRPARVEWKPVEKDQEAQTVEVQTPEVQS